VVECQPSKLFVAGSIPVTRSKLETTMKILIVGTGWTGNKVFQEMLTRKGVSTSIMRHDDALEAVKFHNFVINCAGITGVPNVDACESNPQETMLGNAVFPILLQRECEKYNVRLAHFSSGCIYRGMIDSVDAEPNFFGSIYSISKGISDSYLKPRAMVFRIRMPFTNLNEPKNYLTKVRNYANTAKLYDSGLNSLTDHNEAVRVACDLVLENAPNGAYNLVNQGAITMRELASLMKLDHAQWFTEDEFARATRAGRSTCVIPANERMRSLEVALKESI
jgi:dTDP-4-dehydrorhamnose reductase